MIPLPDPAFVELAMQWEAERLERERLANTPGTFEYGLREALRRNREYYDSAEGKAETQRFLTKLIGQIRQHPHVESEWGVAIRRAAQRAADHVRLIERIMQAGLTQEAANYGLLRLRWALSAPCDDFAAALAVFGEEDPEAPYRRGGVEAVLPLLARATGDDVDLVVRFVPNVDAARVACALLDNGI